MVANGMHVVDFHFEMNNYCAQCLEDNLAVRPTESDKPVRCGRHSLRTATAATSLLNGFNKLVPEKLNGNKKYEYIE